MSSYCQYAPGDPLHAPYHDREYGFPLTDDDELFERLVLEINQAGLSWATILRKRENFTRAYDGFDLAKVASYEEDDRARLMQDAGIIRNRLKINAAIENARRILELQKEFGSFKAWLDQHDPLPKADWVALFKKTFLFTGGEIVGEFLQSIGYLPGAHEASCPIYKKVLKAKPAWRKHV